MKFLRNPESVLCKNAARFRRHFRLLFAVLLVFALLVCDAAARFAGGLAGSLAFAAAALLGAFAKVLGFQCLNGLHKLYPPNLRTFVLSACRLCDAGTARDIYILAQPEADVNACPKDFTTAPVDDTMMCDKR